MSFGDQNSRQRRQQQQQITGVDFLYKSRYLNTLPDLPSDPKFMQCPFIPLNRFIDYRHTTLEKNYKYEPLTEDASMLRIDLIDPMAYHYNPHEKIPLHPKDERLLEDESLSQQNIKRSQQHSKVVPWMRKTEYIGTEFSRFGAERTEALRGVKSKKQERGALYRDRDSQINAIEKTFEAVRRPVIEHHSKKGATAIAELPVLPDFELWKYNFIRGLFDIDPLPHGKDEAFREERLQHAVIRGITDSEGRSCVGYFAPDEAALKRLKEAEERGEDNDGECSYEYPLEREYDYEVEKKKDEDEQGHYFFVERDGKVYYNEIQQSVRLTRRGKKRTGKNSILRLNYTQPGEEELKSMTSRLNHLLHPAEAQNEEIAEDIEGEQTPQAQAPSDKQSIDSESKNIVSGRGTEETGECEAEHLEQKHENGRKKLVFDRDELSESSVESSTDDEIN